MNAPRIGVAALGGTIAMTSESGRGVTPTLAADDLIGAVPRLGEVADITATTLATWPSASVTSADLTSVIEWADDRVAAGASGIVVTQGTDSIEETSYWLDLHWDRPEPLVVTGAMRPPTTPGADGPANLLAAVLTASSQEARDRGVLVVMGDTVHTAVEVLKGRSSHPDAFVSRPFGPLGFLEEERLHLRPAGVRRPALPMTKGGTPPSVALLETHLDDTGDVLDLVVQAGHGGVVIAGFGVGHVPERMVDAVQRAIDADVVVVMATRAGDGPTHRSSYGYAGSEVDLLARGVVPAGWLHPRKARVLLAELLRRGVGLGEVREEFADRGAVRPETSS
ncbi:asparaginase [Janibacter sp. DB-40]|uniref:asparaginase n=1 Tax=Janibacter sp. DB-40 TaxID=3028808 RepID=UPI0024069CC0|nr:asparaginase [Janibacter sp. DB-40]